MFCLCLRYSRDAHLSVEGKTQENESGAAQALQADIDTSILDQHPDSGGGLNAKLDLGGSYQLLSWLGIYAQGDNLLNNRHIAPIGYISLPTDVRLGLRLQWGKEKAH